MPANDPRKDLRQFGRRESFVHAFVVLDNGRQFHCVVRNYSENGALLEFEQTANLPRMFRLIIEAKGVDVACEVRHSGRYGVGVKFLTRADVSTLDAAFTNGQGGAEALPPRPRKKAEPMSSKDLRRTVLGIAPSAPVADSTPARPFQTPVGKALRHTQ